MRAGSRQVLSALMPLESGRHAEAGVGVSQRTDAGLGTPPPNTEDKAELKPHAAHFTRFLGPFVTVATGHIQKIQRRDGAATATGGNKRPHKPACLHESERKIKEAIEDISRVGMISVHLALNFRFSCPFIFFLIE